MCWNSSYPMYLIYILFLNHFLVISARDMLLYGNVFFNLFQSKVIWLFRKPLRNAFFPFFSFFGYHRLVQFLGSLFLLGLKKVIVKTLQNAHFRELTGLSSPWAPMTHSMKPQARHCASSPGLFVELEMTMGVWPPPAKIGFCSLGPVPSDYMAFLCREP